MKRRPIGARRHRPVAPEFCLPFALVADGPDATEPAMVRRRRACVCDWIDAARKHVFLARLYPAGSQERAAHLSRARIAGEAVDAIHPR